MNHRVKAIACPHEIRACYLAGFTELLLMPYYIVIKKQRLRKFVDYWATGIDYDFPQLIEVASSLHPVGELKPIRSAFSQVANFMREKISLFVTLSKELFYSVFGDLPEMGYSGRAHYLSLRICQACESPGLPMKTSSG
jgi:hypothetical protein